MHVRCDSDNFSRLCIGTKQDVLTDGVRATWILRPEQASKILTNDCYPRRPQVIVRGKISSPFQCNLHCWEVLRSNFLEDRDGAFIELHRRTPGYLQAGTHPTRHWQRQGQRRTADSMDCIYAPYEFAIELGLLFVRVIACRWKPDFHRE